jgi:dUTP pyrophosphatase
MFRKIINKLFGVAKFEKVSFEQFKAPLRESFGDMISHYSDESIRALYDALPLPRRATRGSAGYDFFVPLTFTLPAGATIKVPTGIRCRMKKRWVMMAFPRSGLGFKYRLRLNNTVGIVDQDYYYSDNEGHIFFKISNETNEGKFIAFKAYENDPEMMPDAFAQAIFVKFGITEDDDATAIRNGGEGSTSNKK